MAHLKKAATRIALKQKVVVWENLPRSNIGKVLKKDIRAHYQVAPSEIARSTSAIIGCTGAVSNRCDASNPAQVYYVFGAHP